MTPQLPFWKTKTLEEMTPVEWESLCDGCARCCLFKLEDEDTGEIAYTNVVCRLLDQPACRCTAYFTRTTLVPTCLVMTPERSRLLKWAPSTCAYRLLAEGKDLPWWHPLISGTPRSVHLAGISVRAVAIPETPETLNHLSDYVVDFLR
jgi:uncharacterized cysteine cluster protein YcgN (CxxCxxCC family)